MQWQLPSPYPLFYHDRSGQLIYILFLVSSSVFLSHALGTTSIVRPSRVVGLGCGPGARAIWQKAHWPFKLATGRRPAFGRHRASSSPRRQGAV